MVTLIGFSILRHVPHLIFNLVLSELLSVKIEESNIYIYIYIGFSILSNVPHLIFNLMPSELLSVKIEESKFN